jgi:hypothetical protein
MLETYDVREVGFARESFPDRGANLPGVDCAS